MFDARKQGALWVSSPSEMVERLSATFDFFLSDLVCWDDPDVDRPVKIEDLPLSTELGIDFESGGHVEERWWLQLSWLSHAIEVAWRLDPTVPAVFDAWQDLANECYDVEGDWESRNLANAVNAVRESLREVAEWAASKTLRIKKRSQSGSVYGLTIIGDTISRDGFGPPVRLSSGEHELLNAVCQMSPTMDGQALANRLATNTKALGVSINRLNQKLSKVGLVVRRHKLQPLED